MRDHLTRKPKLLFAIGDFLKRYPTLAKTLRFQNTNLEDAVASLLLPRKYDHFTAILRSFGIRKESDLKVILSRGFRRRIKNREADIPELLSLAMMYHDFDRFLAVWSSLGKTRGQLFISQNSIEFLSGKYGRRNLMAILERNDVKVR